MPKNNAGLTCPVMKGRCIEHRCAWYIQLMGTSKNTGESVNEFGCAVAWLPMLLVENANEQRQTAASVDSLRNESVRNSDATRQVMIAGLFGPQSAQPDLFQLEGNKNGGT